MSKVTIPILKEKLRSLGLTVGGNKADLIERLNEYLGSLKMNDLRAMCPEGIKKPQDKESLIQVLIETDQLFKNSDITINTSNINTTINNSVSITNSNITINISSTDSTTSNDTIFTGYPLSKAPISKAKLSSVGYIVGVKTLKEKLKSLGLTVSGNKTDLIERLNEYLGSLKMNDLRALCPDGIKKPQDKESLIRVLIETDQPFKNDHTTNSDNSSNINNSDINTNISNSISINNSTINIITINSNSTNSNDTIFNGYSIPTTPISKEKLLSVGYIVGVKTLKEKLRSLGLTMSGNKDDLIERLNEHLSSLKINELIDMCPDGIKKPTNKEQLIWILIATDQPFPKK
jgi:hypothetical protein